MAKNPFKVLGVTENVTQSELFEAYDKLKDKYSELRFEPGERGKDACDKLTEIEDAYRDAISILENRYYVDNTAEVLDSIEELIRQKNFDEAQDKLNKLNVKDARWHYLQGGLYYQKSWHNDARRELQLAVSLDPSNGKYRETLQDLEQKMSNSGATNSNFYQARQYGNGDRSYNGQNNPNNYNNRGGGMSPCDCCTSLICADCCCECMGGDLIRCC